MSLRLALNVWQSSWLVSLTTGVNLSFELICDSDSNHDGMGYGTEAKPTVDAWSQGSFKMLSVLTIHTQ